MVAAKVTNRLVVSDCLFPQGIRVALLYFQVAHMTKNEMEYMDVALVGPGLLFFNQYFNTFMPEYFVLWLCVVSIDYLFSVMFFNY